MSEQSDHSVRDAHDAGLILPGEFVADRASLAQFAGGEVVWLRNPVTGVIHKFHAGDARAPRDNDTIQRCLRDGYTRSSEAAAREQAIALAELQGRPAPVWPDAKDAKVAAAKVR